jgi:hypothetical protein
MPPWGSRKKKAGAKAPAQKAPPQTHDASAASAKRAKQSKSNPVSQPKGKVQGKKTSGAATQESSSAKRPLEGSVDEKDTKKSRRSIRSASKTLSGSPSDIQAAASVPAQGQQQQQHGGTESAGTAKDADDEDGSGASVIFDDGNDHDDDDNNNNNNVAPAAAPSNGGNTANSEHSIVFSENGAVTSEDDMTFADFEAKMSTLIQAQGNKQSDPEEKELIQKYPVLIAQLLRNMMKESQSHSNTVTKSAGLNAEHSASEAHDESVESNSKKAGIDLESDSNSIPQDKDSNLHVLRKKSATATAAAGGAIALQSTPAPAPAPAPAGIHGISSDASMQQQVQIYQKKSKKEQDQFLSTIRASFQGHSSPRGTSSANITVATEVCSLPNLQQMLKQDNVDGGHKPILTSFVRIQRIPCTTCTLNSEWTLTLVARYPCSPSLKMSACKSSPTQFRRSTKP